MGKKLDALLGRTFKVSKFKSLVNLAITRLGVLKNHRQVKFSQAMSDVSQLLQLGHHERALLRVEQVIKEQNMLDVFVMTEGYCNLLIERVHVVEQGRECPEELKEAISSLLFAASRVGEFPELNEIRASLTSRYGRELAARSIELRNNRGVNPKMIQKLSTRPPDLETRMKVLKEIAAEKNIVLKLDEAFTSVLETAKTSKHPDASASLQHEEVLGNDYGLSDSIRSNKKYKDVADAAQAAFESAAYAAAAARAAVELSRADSHDHDNHDGPSDAHNKKQSDESENQKPQTETKPENMKSYPDEGSDCKNSEEEPKRMVDDLSSDSEDVVWVNQIMSFREQDPVKLLEKETIIYDSEEETSKIKDKKDLIGMNLEKAGLGHAGKISVRTRQVRGY